METTVRSRVTGTIARWGRWRPLTDEEAETAANEWAAVLRVRHRLVLQRVDRQQVMDHRGRRGCSLVGVVYDDARACIYHTRRLNAEDLVHELLHVAHPEWSEAAVVAETARILTSGEALPRAKGSVRMDVVAPVTGSRQMAV